MRGLLIVNADDWGAALAATTAILTAFRAGAVTSTSAMVFMADSERAAEVAREESVPTGLHLNLSQRFDGETVPAKAQDHHERALTQFRDPARARWRFTRAAHRAATLTIRDQLAEFRRIYGRPPTHVDSHHHVHVSPSVFLSPALTPGSRVRQTRSPAPHAPRVWAGPRVARRVKHRLLSSRFHTTQRFWAIDDVHPARGGSGFDRAASIVHREPVEIMCHPSFAEDLPLLLDQPWLDFVRSTPSGSYEAL